MTPEEAIALAKSATRREGWAWPEPIQALRCQVGTLARGWFWEVFSSPGPDRWLTFARLDEATLAEEQRLLHLLIERVIVGEDALEIRHVIPLRRLRPEALAPASPEGPGEGTGPAGTPSAGQRRPPATSVRPTATTASGFTAPAPATWSKATSWAPMRQGRPRLPTPGPA